MNTSKLYPGPQRKSRHLDYVSLILWVLLITFFLLSIYAFFSENLHIVNPSMQSYFNLKILDTKSAITIFVSTLGLTLIRNQFLLGFKPRIIYEGVKLKKGTIDFLHSTENVWSVKIKNVGLGAAVIETYKFRLNPNEGFDLTYHEVIEHLKGKNLYREKDFFLNNITQGYTISAKDNLVIFELVLFRSEVLSCLDVQMTFQGFLGARYIKEVFCIPRNGIPNLISDNLS